MAPDTPANPVGETAVAEPSPAEPPPSTRPGFRLRSRPRRCALWWQRRSLRARLIAAATLVLLVGMSLASGLLVIQQREALVSNLDVAARGRAQDIAANIDQGNFPISLPHADDTDVLEQVVDKHGRVVAASKRIQGRPALFGNVPDVDGSDTPARTARDILRPGDSYQVVAVTAKPPKHKDKKDDSKDQEDGADSSHLMVYVAMESHEVDDSVAELITSLAFGVPVLTLLLAAAGWVLVGRALRPVETLRREARQITATDLHRRLAVPAAADEVRRVAETLNDLLARIEASAIRQRQFVADAAHELRSPLAALRAHLEVAARHPENVDWSVSTPYMLQDTIRLIGLVENLVRLARMDAGGSTRQGEVDLDEIVFTEVRRLRHRSAVPIRTDGIGAARLWGDDDGLARVVQNLLDNAVRHARSQVQVSLRAEDGTITLEIADDGAGVPVADRERIFERFTRLDEARSRDLGGSGLGLAIVQDVVAQHGGTVVVEDNAPGARFRVELPERNRPPSSTASLRNG